METRIITANLSDLETVRDITQKTIRTVYPHYYPAGAVEFFSAHHSDEHIITDLEAGNVYLLEAEGISVGTVTINENHINRLFVLPENQHRGYGRMLMDFAEGIIFEKYKTIELDASFPAKPIYLKRGYKDIGYDIIDTENGDKLCHDIMAKEAT